MEPVADAEHVDSQDATLDDADVEGLISATCWAWRDPTGLLTVRVSVRLRPRRSGSQVYDVGLEPLEPDHFIDPAVLLVKLTMLVAPGAGALKATAYTAQQNPETATFDGAGAVRHVVLIDDENRIVSACGVEPGQPAPNSN